MATIVTWGRTVFGGNARMGPRTAAHLDYTIDRLTHEHPGARLRVMQGGYSTSVAASAGTHDLDGCIDVFVEGMGWWEMQAFTRRCGWASWYRQPPTFPRHLHMVSLGCPGPVGRFVPGQIDDYHNHRNGLAGHARDTSWHPPDIAATVFDHDEWTHEMRPEQLASAPITMLAGDNDTPRKTTLQAVLRDLEGTQDHHGKRLADIEHQLALILKAVT